MISPRSIDNSVSPFRFTDRDDEPAQVATHRANHDDKISSPRQRQSSVGENPQARKLAALFKNTDEVLTPQPPSGTVADTSPSDALIASIKNSIVNLQATGQLSTSHSASPSQRVQLPTLSYEALTALPPKVETKWAEETAKNFFSPALSKTIFRQLNENTENLLSLWETISPRKGRFTNIVETPDQAVKRAIVLQRFGDIPLVENRAIEDAIRTQDNGAKRFLHANHLVFSDGQQFIASQKPVEAEIPGFWHMLLQKKVPAIVDLTNQQDNKNDCDYSFGKERQQGTVQCGPLTITLPGKNLVAKIRSFSPLGSPRNSSANEKTFSVAHGGIAHDVTRIHFKDWPDHGVTSPERLITLADQVEAASRGSNAPVLIHCRAGVGRTGTLISFLTARKRIARELAQTGGPVTVEMIARILLGVTAEGRLGRGPSFVQTEEQFHLAASALAHYFRPIGKPVKTSPSPERSADQGQRRAVRKVLQSAEGEKKDQAAHDNTIPTPRAPRQVRFNSKPQVHLMSARLDINANSDAAQTFSAGASLSTNARADAASDHPTRATSPQPVPESNSPPSRTGSPSNVRNVPNIVIPYDEDEPDLIDLRNQVRPPVVRLWQKLAESVTGPIHHLDRGLIEQEVTGLPCVKDTAVSVMIDGASHYVHANHVRVPQLASSTQPDLAEHRYIAGQSPKLFDTSAKILLKAIESREGIFQLVSPTTHTYLQRDRIGEIKNLSVAPILMQLLAKYAHNEEIIIGNQYRIVPVKRDNMPDHIASYDLQVTPLIANEAAFSIPITQIGLKFDNAVLEVDEIRSANAALDQHLRYNAAYDPHSPGEPIILSRKGIGRNATLIAYHEIVPWIRSGQIDNAADLDKALCNVIAAGRRARGTRFVHSPQQLQELRNALLADMGVVGV